MIGIIFILCTSLGLRFYLGVFVVDNTVVQNHNLTENWKCKVDFCVYLCVCVSYRFSLLLPQLCSAARMGFSRPVSLEGSNSSHNAVQMSLSRSLFLPWPLNPARTNTHYHNTGKSCDIATGYSCEALKTWSALSLFLSLSPVILFILVPPSVLVAKTHRRSSFVIWRSLPPTLSLSLFFFLPFFPSWPAYSFNYHEVMSLSLLFPLSHV